MLKCCLSGRLRFSFLCKLRACGRSLAGVTLILPLRSQLTSLHPLMSSLSLLGLGSLCPGFPDHRRSQGTAALGSFPSPTQPEQSRSQRRSENRAAGRGVCESLSRLPLSSSPEQGQRAVWGTRGNPSPQSSWSDSLREEPVMGPAELPCRLPGAHLGWGAVPPEEGSSLGCLTPTAFCSLDRNPLLPGFRKGWRLAWLPRGHLQAAGRTLPMGRGGRMTSWCPTEVQSLVAVRHATSKWQKRRWTTKRSAGSRSAGQSSKHCRV